MSSLYLEIIFSGGQLIREGTHSFSFGADYLSFASFSKRRFFKGLTFVF
jgi:hypothetical protein